MDINGELLKRIKDLEKRLDALSGQEVLTMTALADLTDGGTTTLHKHPPTHDAANLDDLADVTITTPADGELIRYDGSGWINNTLAEAGIAAADHTHTGEVTNGNNHDHSGGDGAQINHTTLSNIGTTTHAQIDTFISSKAAANGLASLNASSLVVQNPANATATPTASKIPIADGSGDLDAWISDASTTVKGLVELATDGETTAGLAVQASDGRLAIDGWLARSETWTRTSNTTFTVSGDQRAVFVPGAKIKVTQTSTKYFYVVSASYSSPSTTVTITGGSDYSLTASPTERWISYVANPQGFPDWFNWAPTVTGFSSVPYTVAYRFKITGRQVFLVVAQKTNGTSNDTVLTVSLPVTAATIGTGGTWTGTNGYAVDNGTGLTVASRWNINSGGTTIDFYTNMAVGEWTNANGKRVYCVATYEI